MVCGTFLIRWFRICFSGTKMELDYVHNERLRLSVALMRSHKCIFGISMEVIVPKRLQISNKQVLLHSLLNKCWWLLLDGQSYIDNNLTN